MSGFGSPRGSPRSGKKKSKRKVVSAMEDRDLDIMATVQKIQEYDITKEIKITGDFETFAREGAQVTIDYIAMLEDGTVWDSTYDRGVSFTFPSMSGAVIVGLDVCVSAMSLGERATFLIPSEHAYGSRGFLGKVPKDENVQFDISLLKIEDI